MSRSRIILTYGLWAFGVLALFSVFIGFKRDAALVASLSAAGTVAAAGFAAFAAMGSMRAAAESAAAARRSREAIARTARPRVFPSLTTQADGVAVAEVRCGDLRAAIDVTAVWQLRVGGTVVSRSARMEPGSVLDIDLPGGPNPWEEIELVWVEYWDDGHIGQWRDTWEVEAGDARFRQTESDLVD